MSFLKNAASAGPAEHGRIAKTASVFFAASLAMGMIPAAAFAEGTDAASDGSPAPAQQVETATGAKTGQGLDQQSGSGTGSVDAAGAAASSGTGDSGSSEDAGQQTTPSESLNGAQQLNGAIAAAKEAGQTVYTLDADLDLTDVPGGYWDVDISGMTLDLGGHTITCGNNWADGAHGSQGFVTFLGSGATIRNGSFNAGDGSYGLFIGDGETSDDITLSNITAQGINVFNATNVTLKDVTSTAKAYYALWGDENSHITVESGTFAVSEKSTALLGMSATETDMLIKGGTFTANGKPMVLTGQDASAFGTPVITGGTFDEDVSAYVQQGMKWNPETHAVGADEPSGGQTTPENPGHNPTGGQTTPDNPGHNPTGGQTTPANPGDDPSTNEDHGDRPSMTEDTFDDVDGTEYFYGDLKNVYDRGIIRGAGGTDLFAPTLPATRASLITMLYRMSGEPAVDATGSTFADVPANAYYSNAVAWAKTAGITTGYGGTDLFGPNDPVTREQAATFLKRYSDMMDGDDGTRGDLGSFPDGDGVSRWAQDAMAWAAGKGIVKGDGASGRIEPHDGATRAHAAVMISRYIDSTEKA